MRLKAEKKMFRSKISKIQAFFHEKEVRGLKVMVPFFNRAISKGDFCIVPFECDHGEFEENR